MKKLIIVLLIVSAIGVGIYLFVKNKKTISPHNGIASQNNNQNPKNGAGNDGGSVDLKGFIESNNQQATALFEKLPPSAKIEIRLRAGSQINVTDYETNKSPVLTTIFLNEPLVIEMKSFQILYGADISNSVQITTQSLIRADIVNYKIYTIFMPTVLSVKVLPRIQFID